MEGATSESLSGRPAMAALTLLNDFADAVGELSHPLRHGAGGFRHNGTSEKDHSIVVVYQVDNEALVSKGEFSRIKEEAGQSCAISDIKGLTEAQGELSSFPFRCNVCQKCFARKHYLQRHIHVHSGERLHKCSHCSKGFSRKDHLTQHLSSHSGELPYKCATCGKSFSRRDHFKRHLLMHTGEKNFECHVCLRQFSRKDHMNKHVQVVHGISTSTAFGKNLKPVQSTCKHGTGSVAFSPLNSTQRNCNRITSPETSISTKAGKQEQLIASQDIVLGSESSGGSRKESDSGLCVPGSIPNGQKYECSLCAKQFTTSSSLHRHELVHSGERPFQCILCLKQFSRKYHLDRHIKVHNRAKDDVKHGAAVKTSLPMSICDFPLESDGGVLMASLKDDLTKSVCDDGASTGIASLRNALTSDALESRSTSESSYSCIDRSGTSMLVSLSMQGHLHSLSGALLAASQSI